MKHIFSARFYFFIFSLLLFIPIISSSQPISYKGIIKTEKSIPIANSNLEIIVSVLHKSILGQVVYTESQKITTDSIGNYFLSIGTGKIISGMIDSIIWSDESYFLKILSDTLKARQPYFKYTVQLRAPSDFSSENIEGVAIADSSKDWGPIKIVNTKGRMPRKITIDLTTNYVNISYPADTYPIYRHYEWFDEDRNGLGNSLMLTYNEKTPHAFWENTNKLGEVKLYPKAFQELFIKRIDNKCIDLLLTKPIEVINHNQTYSIKGPWKLIYFIEW